MTPQTIDVPLAPSPRLALHEFYVVPMADGALQLRGATKRANLRGALVREVFPLLLPLLDGSLTEVEVLARLADRVSPAKTTQILDALRTKGFLRTVEASPLDVIPAASLEHYETMARFFGQTESPWATLRALRQATVSIVNCTPVAAPLIAALAHFGVGQIRLVGDSPVSSLDVQQSRFFLPDDIGRPKAELLADRLPLSKEGVRFRATPIVPVTKLDWQRSLEGVTMAVALVDGPILFHPWLEAFNAAAIDAGTRWTSVALLDYREIHIGPTILPNVTACYKCFEKRFKSHVAFLEAYDVFERFIQETQAVPKDLGALPPIAEIAANMVALEVVRTLSPEQSPLTSGRLMTFGVTTFETAFHPVLKLPRCPACSPTRSTPAMRIWS